MKLGLATLAVLALGAGAIGTLAGALAPNDVPHGRLSEFKWVDLPEFGGKESIIYRSSDGTRVAAAFHESGSPSFTYPFDEFLVVMSGSVKVRVHGGPSFELAKGDVAYFREGQAVDFQFSDDFSDITSLVSTHEVKWR